MGSYGPEVAGAVQLGRNDTSTLYKMTKSFATAALNSYNRLTTRQLREPQICDRLSSLSKILLSTIFSILYSLFYCSCTFKD